MPSSDYKNTISGGLKLKGAGITKPKHKKSKPKPAATTPTAPEASETIPDTTDAPFETTERDAGALERALADEEKSAELAQPEQLERPAQQGRGDGKTETQRRHEETRRKRLDERLKKEGVKTHKERVEALNKYLSGLSEHHDMPRIGPG
ncbi:hypothetical protein B0A48_04367 [Cryoendolithus antarcticus]|uniref:DUF1754-domain-containing protein n=1 Tax=Cryoendolithus antarcticus TaxID=1507870 RepID=A0A1V8TFL2_9PEZI|nr:hypothetical protein B0A48_04367 [Cryoendolithus antarcticus]